MPKAVQALTDAELLVLGLVAEMPRHGYELERVIDHRGMREWTQIGFSSIYFVLGKLEKAGLVTAKKASRVRSKPATQTKPGSKTSTASKAKTQSPPSPKARKSYALTAAGRKALVAKTLSALKNVRPTYSSVLLGMLHWPVLDRDSALDALHQRGNAVQEELHRLATIQIEQQPLPDYVEALFDFSTGQLKAEAEWIARTLDYMRTKPWLDQGARTTA